MRIATKTYATYLLLAAAIHLALIVPLRAGDNPSEASDPGATDHSATLQGNDLQGWSYGYALSDTIGYEFPDEEEKGTFQLIKEVALWLVVAGFVAFFIIKVFLQGDTDEQDSRPPGKVVPTTRVVIPPQPSGSAP
jgi:hypothetical protein